MRVFEVVSLDFGGTLAYEVSDDRLVYREILSELGYRVGAEDIGRALRDARSWWRAEKRRLGRIWDARAYREFVEHVLESLGLPNSRALALKVARILPLRTRFRVYDDVRPALKELRGMGLRLIVVSNVSSLENLTVYLTQVGLGSSFDLLIASGTVGFEKPHPEIFRIASRELDVPPSRIIHVGDDYEADCLGARAAGLTGVLLDKRGVYEERECLRISKLTDLPDLIAQLRLGR